MANSAKVRIPVERRYSYDGPELLAVPHPRSISMGPDVTFAAACGDEDAKALVEGWSPTFRWA